MRLWHEHHVAGNGVCHRHIVVHMMPRMWWCRTSSVITICRILKLISDYICCTLMEFRDSFDDKLLESDIRVFFLTHFHRIKMDLLHKSFNHLCGPSQVELTLWSQVGDLNIIMKPTQLEKGHRDGSQTCQVSPFLSCENRLERILWWFIPG